LHNLYLSFRHPIYTEVNWERNAITVKTKIAIVATVNVKNRSMDLIRFVETRIERKKGRNVINKKYQT
jgi:hypothetical protein